MAEEGQYIKECKYCEEIIREDEKLKSFREIYSHLEQLFDSKLGNFESNSKRIDFHNKWLWLLTVSNVIIIGIVGYILIFR